MQLKTTISNQQKSMKQKHIWFEWNEKFQNCGFSYILSAAWSLMNKSWTIPKILTKYIFRAQLVRQPRDFVNMEKRFFPPVKVKMVATIMWMKPCPSACMTVAITLTHLTIMQISLTITVFCVPISCDTKNPSIHYFSPYSTVKIPGMRINLNSVKEITRQGTIA